MYRVLIVDDEPWVVYGISKLIDWEKAGFQVAGESFDGVDAAEWIREHRPDVVISDIRMPGLDGIELLAEIKRLGLEAEVILVSGYSEFEYAQRALRLGAFDYLLKQIEKELLAETMGRLKAHLDRKRQAALDAASALDDLFDLLESEPNSDIGSFFEIREKAEHPHYRIVNGVFPPSHVSRAPRDMIGMDGIGGFALRTGLHKLTFLLNYDDDNPIVLLNWISDRLSGATNIGIGTIGQAADSLARLYCEADVALYTSLFYPDLPVVRYQTNEPPVGTSGLLLQLELGIKEQKSDVVQASLRQLAEECVRQQPYVDHVAGIYNQVVSLIHKYYGRAGAFHEVEFASYDQMGRIGGSADSMFERLLAIVDQESAPDYPVMHEQVKNVMSFIDDHFTEDLMLGAIAKQFNLSLSYLSHLIKKETGKTYSEYVSGKRIALAKELLADGTLSVHEIVQRVGYKDYFHFNKWFQKHVGLTPSKFRKL